MSTVGPRMPQLLRNVSSNVLKRSGILGSNTAQRSFSRSTGNTSSFKFRDTFTPIREEAERAQIRERGNEERAQIEEKYQARETARREKGKAQKAEYDRTMAKIEEERAQIKAQIKERHQASS
jgi:hypothetical protein